MPRRQGGNQDGEWRVVNSLRERGWPRAPLGDPWVEPEGKRIPKNPLYFQDFGSGGEAEVHGSGREQIGDLAATAKSAVRWIQVAPKVCSRTGRDPDAEPEKPDSSRVLLSISKVIREAQRCCSRCCYHGARITQQSQLPSVELCYRATEVEYEFR